MPRGRSRERVSNERFEYQRIHKKRTNLAEVFSSLNSKVLKQIYYLCFTYVLWRPNNALLNSVPIVLERWETRKRGKVMSAQGEKGNSLRRRGNQTPVSNVCEAAPRSLFCPPPPPPRRTQRITRSAFRISFQSDWLIDNGIFNRPIMARTEILVHRWGPRSRILALFRRQA